MNINLAQITGQNRKDEVKIESKEDALNYLIQEVVNPYYDLPQENKEELEARIQAKLSSGKKLTPEEEEYLQQTNPTMYLQYKRIQAMAENMKTQLKHARTKHEADTIITITISGISDKDPCKEYVVAALGEAAREFKASSEYKKLPDTEVELERRKQYSKIVANEYEKESEKDFEPMAWSPLQEVIDALPTFDFSA